VETLRRGGLGVLYEAFEKLKAKLNKEGLFDPGMKKPLPPFPKTLGIVTSPQAAALKDVLTTLRRRMPGMQIILYPTPVQGKSAGAQIARTIQLASERHECGILILCRGGGGIEDLWCFNDEAVARAVAACTIPVVTGIGHETDFTLADFVADLRAATPTAAAEIASPNQAELMHKLGLFANRIKRHVGHQQQTDAQRLDSLARRLKHPAETLAARQLNLRQLAARLQNHFQQVLERRRWQQRQFVSQLTHLVPAIPATMKNLQWQAAVLHTGFGHTLRERQLHLTRLHGHLRHLNPQAVLERGYSITQNAQGHVIRAGSDLKVGEALHLSFAKGAADVRVEDADEDGSPALETL
jgi:exodeoxyribonuclease VII large subunit